MRKKNILFSITFVLFLGGLTWLGIHWSKSSFFSIQEIQITGLQKHAPLSLEELQKEGEKKWLGQNLFSFSLHEVESFREEKKNWLKSIRALKKFPSTLELEVEFHEPLALWASPQGEVRYLDQSGNAFGSFFSEWVSDLPVVTGDENLTLVVQWIKLWNVHPATSFFRLEELRMEPVHGLMGLVSYGLERGPGYKKQQVWIEFGQKIDDFSNDQINRIARTLRYLSKNQIVAERIRSEDTKKLVVKISQGF